MDDDIEEINYTQEELEVDENEKYKHLNIEILGTKEQDFVIDDYPTRAKKYKFKVPYIEKQNGNIRA